MESTAAPLRRLNDDATWFARATELRLLHVTCSTNLRAAALKTLVGSIEFHPDNRSPMLSLEDARTSQDPGWKLRTQRMVEDWEGRVMVLAEHDVELGTLAGQVPASADPLAAFGGWVHLILQRVLPPLEGLVVMLAPTRIEEPESFERELRDLITRPELSGVRWVIVDVQEAPLDALHEELGETALRSECVRDDDAFADDLNALMSSIDPEMPGPARVGTAWPREIFVPPRPGQPAPATPEQQAIIDAKLVEAGVNPVLAGPDGNRMQQYMLAAAVQLKRGESLKAIEHQREACRIAYDAGARREAVLQHLVLAGYELTAGLEREAEADYRTASERAEEWQCPLEHAQANLALALLEARRGHHAEAAKHYAASANSAFEAEAIGLAIEGWRLAGQMAAEANLDERASECFGRAIELAEDSEPDVARSSSAPEAARQLAARLRAKGLSPQADSLEHTANRLEEGMPRSVEALL